MSGWSRGRTPHAAFARGARRIACAGGARYVPVAALLVLLAGCSMLVPKFATPRLSIESVTLERGDLLSQHLKVRMQVENPNDRALPVKGLEYSIYVEGEEAAHGVSDASFTVPALGVAEFDMDVTANMAGTLLRLLSRVGESHADRIDYRIAGKVELSRGLLRSIPFEQYGAFRLR